MDWVLRCRISPTPESCRRARIWRRFLAPKAQSAARAHLGCFLGTPQLVEDEIIKVNCERLQRCATDEIAEPTGRKKPQGTPAGLPGFNRNLRRKGFESRNRSEKLRTPKTEKLESKNKNEFTNFEKNSEMCEFYQPPPEGRVG